MSLIIRAGILILNLIYCFMKLLPQQKKIVFLSRQGDSPSVDFTMLEKKIKELHPDYETIMLCKKLNIKDHESAIDYGLHMLVQMYHLATSDVAILDSYCIAVSVLHHKKSLLVIQMWHSIGTMKKFGYSILDKPEGSPSKLAKLMKMHANYDYILAAGDGYKEHLAEGFNYPLDKIVTLPLPRMELLKDEDHRNDTLQKIFKIYPELSAKENILYVPTFRKVNDELFMSALRSICQAADYDKYNLIIKVHPNTNLTNFNPGRAILDTEFSSEDMLFISDIVISDYSCIIYEAALMNIPLYFYTYDYEKYMKAREVYMDYKAEIPGPMEPYPRLVFERIASRDEGADRRRVDKFLHKYIYTGSKHETEDIVNFIFDHLKNKRRTRKKKTL